MTNAEIIQAIRTEIERRKKALHSTLFNDEYNDFLSFLDTLESEKPRELDEEIKRFVAEYGYERSEDILLIAIVARHFYDLGCHRTAEKYDEIEYNRQGAEESVPKDLEEAAESHAKTKYGLTRLLGAEMKEVEDDFIAGAKWQEEKVQETISLAEDHAFLAGADWQAEQLLKSSPLPEDTVLFNKGVEEGKRLMMEEAVEKYVHELYTDEDGYHCYISLGSEYAPGDKVRVIVIPNTDDK